jgi:hypothetical protein
MLRQNRVGNIVMEAIPSNRTGFNILGCTTMAELARLPWKILKFTFWLLAAAVIATILAVFFPPGLLIMAFGLVWWWCRDVPMPPNYRAPDLTLPLIAGAIGYEIGTHHQN